MDAVFLQTLWITLRLAGLTTIILIIIGLPFSYWLSNSHFRFKPVIEALVSMPMVLPPTVIGYYMLLLYSPHNWFGAWLNREFDIRLAFTFGGILFASVIFSLPFMIQPLYNGLRSVPENLQEASYTLGKSKMTTFIRVLIPNIKSSMITAIALTFAHSIGEFGIVLMVGGDMPGETRVASIAIYDELQALNFKTANHYALTLIAVSFIILVFIYSNNRRFDSWKII